MSARKPSWNCRSTPPRTVIGINVLQIELPVMRTCQAEGIPVASSPADIRAIATGR
jgi:hypothetical protein